MVDKKGQLEVEVIRARGLTQKPGSKSTPGKGKKICTENKNMKRADKRDLRRFELLHLHLFGLLFNKECVHGYILATTVHFLPPCICHLHATFQEMIFSNSSSDVERKFGEIFLCILGKSYILVNVDKVLSVCSTSKQETENRWKCFKQTT